MKAVVVGLREDNYEVKLGQMIDVLGFTYQPINNVGGSVLKAIWRDEHGYVWDIVASAIRVLPNNETTERDTLRRLRDHLTPSASKVNAIAGPQTGRGVR